MSLEFHLFLPQMRMTFDELVERSRCAERSGFRGVAFMDHLVPPAAHDQPMYEAMTTAGWVAAKTTTLVVGHLVLCDPLRHPAVLAKAAVSLDHASGGRFELGLGWGSYVDELVTYGIGSPEARHRVERLSESLEAIRGLWAAESVELDGAHHRIDGGFQRPTPLHGIPIVIGGAGPRTMELVARHADWWNLPVYAMDRLDALRDRSGRARLSIQLLVTLITDERERNRTVELAERRFAFVARDGWLVGTADEITERLHALEARGVERVYTWFTDFAASETLETFGAEVIPTFQMDTEELRRTHSG